MPRLLLQTDALVEHNGPYAPWIEDGTTHPGFYLRRARAGLDGATGDWRARAIVEATSRPEIVSGPVDPIGGELSRAATATATAAATATDPRATEAYVAYAPSKAFSLTGGSQRVPLGLSRQVDEADLSLPERARIITRGTPDFRVGVAARGDLGLMQYAAGTFAAAPMYGAGFSSGGALTVVRLAAEPIGPVGVAPQLRGSGDPWYRWWRFSAGVSAFYATLPGPNELGVGGDGQFQWARCRFAGEVLWTRRNHADRVGFTLEPGVFVVRDRVELVGRLEWYNDQIGPQSLADAWGGALGATWFSATGHVRLQAAYSVRHTLLSGGAATGWGLLRATFVL